jgi:hypothetical protein
MVDEHLKRVRTLATVSLLLGIWLIISSTALHAAAGVSRNGLIVGVLVVAGASVRLAARHSSAVSWVLAALGAWLVMSPWVVGGVTGDFRTWNFVIVGVALAGIETFSLTSSSLRRPWSFRGSH